MSTIIYGGVNGTGVSKLDIYNDDGFGNPGAFNKTITFHQAVLNGRTDTYVLKQKRHELWDNSLVTRNDGFMIKFKISFEELSLVENTLNIGNKLMQDICQNKHLILTPRVDVNLIRYEVVPDDDFEVEMQECIGGVNSIGNRNIILNFITKFPTKNIYWYSPSSMLFGIDPDNYTIL